MLTEIQKAEIQLHAIEQYNLDETEVCGFILIDGSVLRARNIADKPKVNYLTDIETSIKAERAGIIAVYHSHTNGNGCFTYADAVACKQKKVPFVLYDVHGGSFSDIDPSGNTPYLGRTFCCGIYDCYSLIQDFYKHEFGITLDEFERPIDLTNGRPILDKTWNKFSEEFQNQGFERLNPSEIMQRGDVILFALNGGNPRHIGVVDDVEKQLFLHQLVSEKSKHDIWGGSWRDCAVAILRHSQTNIST